MKRCELRLLVCLGLMECLEVEGEARQVLQESLSYGPTAACANQVVPTEQRSVDRSRERPSR